MSREKKIAPEGMVFTNGETYGKELYLGKFDSPENWHKITEEEAEKLFNTEPEEV